MNQGRDWLPRVSTCEAAIKNIQDRYGAHSNHYDVIRLIPVIEKALQKARKREYRFRLL